MSSGSHVRHGFAMLVHVEPEGQETRWLRILREAKPEMGMEVTVRSAGLLSFCVEEDAEFLAIDRAMRWLQNLGAAADPPITLGLNAQPDNEV